VSGIKPAIRWIPIIETPLRLILGLGLGAIFLYVGLHKSLAPYEFAEAVLAYQLLPQVLVGLTVAVLPLLEMAAGGLLVLGYLAESGGRLIAALGLTSQRGLPGGTFRRSALLLIVFQLVLFMAVLLITLARGLDIDCGCGLWAERQVGLMAILEDALLLGVAGWLYWREIDGAGEALRISGLAGLAARS
jgi:putative oxidoreductase